MNISIVPFPEDPEVGAAVGRFNGRLIDAGFEDYQFSESPNSKLFPKVPGCGVWMEYFLAMEPPEVRGGYILKFLQFWSYGEKLGLTFLKLPVSDGVGDPKYALVGIDLLRDSAKRGGSVYALGMGGVDGKLPKLLKRLRWTVVEIPFYFRVMRASRCLRQLQPMRRTRFRRVAFGILGFTGLAAVGFRLLQSRRRKKLNRSVSVSKEERFGEWADIVWESGKREYGWVGQRDSSILNILYAETDPRFIRVRVQKDGREIGWSLALVTDLKGHKQFGTLRVATIVDGFALLDDVGDVVRAATEFVESMKPDLIISNQQHSSWRAGMEFAGFLSGPSNFALALSPKAEESFLRPGGKPEEMHFNRGDGDGPIHL